MRKAPAGIHIYDSYYQRKASSVDLLSTITALLELQSDSAKIVVLEMLAGMLFENSSYYPRSTLRELRALLAQHPGVQAKLKALQAQARQGEAGALRELGVSLAYGLHGQVQPVQAIGLLKRAAAKRDGLAARCLGVYLSSEDGAACNARERHGKPMDWILKAARLGDQGSLKYAVEWLTELVVPLDRYLEAAELLKVAAGKGDGWAKKTYKEIHQWDFEDGSPRVTVEGAKGLRGALAPSLD